MTVQDGEITAAPAGTVDLSAGIAEAVARMTLTTALRRERAELMRRHRAGLASDGDLRRYRTVRLALGLHRSPAHRPELPPSVDDVLGRRAELIVERLLGPEVADPSVAS